MNEKAGTRPDMTRPLLHVGYHKTATTWMQSRLFQPDHGFLQLASHREIFELIVKPHGLSFDPAPARDLIARRRADLPRGHVPVLSSEILSGSPFDGGRDSDVYAQRLRTILPAARILISIRSQLKILPSVYMQYLRRGGTMSWRQFFEGTDVPGYFGFRAEHFEYHRLVELYRRLFGPENVYVLPQESLKADAETACADLARFAGAADYRGLAPAAKSLRGVSEPEYAAPILRRVNHLQRSALNPAPAVPLGTSPNMLYRSAGFVMRHPWSRRLAGDRRPVSAHVAAVFAGRFADSNRALAAMLGRDVDLTGYEGLD